MARKTPSRLELRKQAEAVEAAGGEKGGEEKKTRSKSTKAAAPRAKRTKEKVLARKRLVWVVYSGSMKEEGRFPYDQLEAAHEKIEQLKLKSKKLYFIQPVKEILGEGGVVIAKSAAAIDLDDEPVKPKKKPARSEDDDEEEEEADDDDDDE